MALLATEMKLSIGYVTCRNEPRLEWFFDSLRLQISSDDDIQLVIIDPQAQARRYRPPNLPVKDFVWTTVKPNIWQGPHRITKQDWWANSASRNTFLCLAKHEFVACLDDRCVLLPGWLDSIKAAMAGKYAVAGAYEKRTGITVENGVIKHAGIVTGVDTREKYVSDNKITPPYPCPGSWFFGCNFALPLEWALKVGGFEELMDGMSFEDVIFGKMVENNGFPIKYDPRSKIIEDRTPGECGPVMRREDRGELGTPRDKSHKSLELFATKKQTQHEWNLRAVRDSVLQGNSFPVPSKKAYYDWFDGTEISKL